MSRECVPLFIWLEPLHLSTLRGLDHVASLGILELAFIVYGVAMLLFFYVLQRLDVTQATLGELHAAVFHRSRWRCSC